MSYQLVVVRGRSANQVLKLPSEGVTTVGRQQGCQIRIGSSQVSRKHCELFEKHGHLLVKDLGSSNGTIVNGKKIDGQLVLEPGNILQIGAVAFRVEKAGTPVAEPVAAPSAGPADTAVPAEASVGDEADIDLDYEQTDEEFASEAPAEAEVEAEAEAEAEVEAKAADEAEPETPAEPEAAEAATEESSLLTSESEKEIGEDAVAEYLLNIELDDDDKL